MAALPTPASPTGVAGADELVLHAALSAYLGRYRGQTRLHTGPTCGTSCAGAPTRTPTHSPRSESTSNGILSGVGPASATVQSRSEQPPAPHLLPACRRLAGCRNRRAKPPTPTGPA